MSHDARNLPPVFKKVASAAENGSLPDLLRLETLMKTRPENQMHAILPAFYANIAPVTLPTDEQLDDLFPGDRLVVARAWISLRAIQEIYDGIWKPLATVWPHLWRWFQFFLAYGDGLPPIPEPQPTEAQVCVDMASFARRFYGSPDVHVIFSGPQFLFTVAKMWVIATDLDDTDSVILGYKFATIGLFLRMTDATDEMLEEVVSGAGGSLADVAGLVSEFISRILPDRHEPLPWAGNIDLLDSLMRFITDVDDGRATSENSPGPLLTELLPLGFVMSLTNLAYSMAESDLPEAVPLLSTSLTMLCRILTSSAHGLVHDALHNGILHIIVSCGISGQQHPQLVTLLEDILPSSLIYYYNVESLEDAMSQIQDLVSSEAFQTSWIFPKWPPFAALAGNRLNIMTAYLRRRVQPFKACDNTECGRINHNIYFWRCSGCRTSYYCSAECRKADWRGGGHREYCAPNESFRLGEHQNLTMRERSYMRDGVLTFDYERNKLATIYPQKVLFMARNPGVPFFTRFDYTHGRVLIQVLPLTGPFAMETFGANAEWRHDCARAARSGGRMELDVIAIPAGRETRYFVVPLPVSNSVVHDILKRLAAQSPFARDPPDIPRLIAEIREALPESGPIAMH